MTARIDTLTADDLIENFGVLDDWEDRYSYLIDLGKALPDMPEHMKTEENRIQGCVSRVWLCMDKNADGTIMMHIDSDAHIVRGLAAILYILFRGVPADMFSSVDVDGAFGKMGLDEHLTPNRRNGFASMTARIKSYSGF